jgi:predicted PurR-regulated permease PerM
MADVTGQSFRGNRPAGAATSLVLGVLGALVAIPAAAAIQSAVRDWWRFRHGATAQAPPPVA